MNDVGVPVGICMYVQWYYSNHLHLNIDMYTYVHRLSDQIFGDIFYDRKMISEMLFN